MRWLICLAAALLAACGAGFVERPNVLVIVMDTTRADRMSLYGHLRNTTPFLDDLARESTVFASAWSPTCWTGPAHASLFTGLRPERHGFKAGVRLYLDERAVTLAELLSGAGYATACLTCNPTVDRRFGLVQGFDTFEKFAEIPGAKVTASSRASAQALAITRQHRKDARPWFLFVNYLLPHLPYHPPPDLERTFLPADATDEEVAWGRAFVLDRKTMFEARDTEITPRQWTILAGLYEAEIAALDAELERFVSALRDEGALDDTLLVITSDHGENLGDHGYCGHYMSLHQSVRRIPLIVRLPGRFPAGKRVDSVVRLEDVFTTILEVCGQPLPDRLDGLTLVDPERGRISLAVLGGELSPDAKEEFPDFARSGRWRPMRAVFDGRFHYIGRQDGVEELFDLLVDPTETKNLVTSEPAVLRRLRGLFPGMAW